MALTADDNTFTDLSGTSASNSGNPYDPLIETCSNDPVRNVLPSNQSPTLKVAGKDQATLSDAPRSSQRAAKGQDT